MSAMGDKYKGKPNKYLTGSIEKAKQVIRQYEANLKACPSACDMSAEALEARLLGKGAWTKNNSLIFNHANDCPGAGCGGCRPSCQINPCPNDKCSGLSLDKSRIGAGICAKSPPGGCGNTSGDSIISSCGLGCLSELDTASESKGESVEGFEPDADSLAQRLNDALKNLDDGLF